MERQSAERRPVWLFRLLRTLERSIYIALALMLMLAILVSTVELAWTLVGELQAPPFLRLDMNELLEIFGFFMMILIGLELLETVSYTHLRAHET